MGGVAAAGGGPIPVILVRPLGRTWIGAGHGRSARAACPWPMLTGRTISGRRPRLMVGGSDDSGGLEGVGDFDVSSLGQGQQGAADGGVGQDAAGDQGVLEGDGAFHV